MFDHDACPDKHTPQTPNKDRARQWWMSDCNLKGTALTISPGALPAFRWMGWKGNIYICDICRPCVTHAQGMRRYYPELQIQNPLHLSIQEAVRLYCAVNAKHNKLAAVDVDLAFTLQNTMPILLDVLNTLVEFKMRTKVLLTYVNHRDGLGGRWPGDNSRRICLLKSRLPKGVKYVDSHNYASGWSNEHHKYSKGSAMSVAMLEV